MIDSQELFARARIIRDDLESHLRTLRQRMIRAETVIAFNANDDICERRLSELQDEVEQLEEAFPKKS